MDRITTKVKSSGHFRVNWRRYEPRDKDAVLALRAKQEVLWGPLDTPDLDDHPVIRAEVAEDEEGNIVGAFFLESCPSVSIIGDAKTTALLSQHALEVLDRLKSCGFRVLQFDIPQTVNPRNRAVMLREVLRIGRRTGHKFQDLTNSVHGFFDLRGSK